MHTENSSYENTRIIKGKAHSYRPIPQAEGYKEQFMP